jgi:hypothetical protein
MILKEAEIRKAVLKTLLNDKKLIKEFKLGTVDPTGMSTGVRCNLDDIPKEFFEYFQAISSGNRARIIELIDKDIEKIEQGQSTFFKNADNSTITKLKNSKSDLAGETLKQQGHTDRLERAQKLYAGKGWYGIASKLLLPLGAFGLSMMGFNKNTCDGIKLVVVKAMKEVIAPLLGAKIDISKISTPSTTSNTLKKDKGSTASYESKTYQDFHVDYTLMLHNKSITDRQLSKELQLNFNNKKYNLELFDLAMFELYANDSYVNLCKNKAIDSEEVKTAKHKIKFIKEVLADKGDSTKAIKAILGRYVDLDQSQGTRINRYIDMLDSFPFEDYFTNDDEAKKFFNFRLAKLLKFLKQF